MYSCHKNSYLQANFKDVNPGLLNRAVQKAWGEINIDEHDLAPPFNRLTSEQPHIPVENVDLTRRPQGFGRWAMPKLRRELHDKEHKVQIAALTTICDLVHDPERGYEAINLNVVDRLSDLTTDEIPEIRERAAICLTILAHLAQGKEAIAGNKILLANLADCVDDSWKQVKLQVAACLEMVARFWCAADSLCDAGFVQILLGSVSHEDEVPEILELHLETLKHLTYGSQGKKISLEENAFAIILKLLERSEGSILAKGCEFLTNICTTKEGRKLAKKANLLPQLNRLLHDEGCEFLTNICTTKEGRKLAKKANLLPQLNRLLHDERKEVYTAAAQAIMFCTVTSSEKIRASKIKSLPKRLVQLTKNRLHTDTQMFAIRCLTNICEHPEVRKEVREKYCKDIKEMQLEKDSNLECFKSNLIAMLNWVPQSKSTLEKTVENIVQEN